jgi:hypothetical protein
LAEWAGAPRRAAGGSFRSVRLLGWRRPVTATEEKGGELSGEGVR